MKWILSVKRTQIVDIVFDTESDSTDEAEAKASEIYEQVQKEGDKPFENCKEENVDYDYALESEDPSGPIIFRFDEGEDYD